MANIDLKQAANEVVAGATANLDVKQVAVEAVFLQTGGNAEVKQVTAEVVFSAIANTTVNIAQVTAEVPVSNVVTNLRLNQAVAEVVSSAIVPTQIIGGNFQDAAGNPIANGTLQIRLSTDAVTPNPSVVIGAPQGRQIGAGRTVTVSLDANGNIDGVLYLWSNSWLSPFVGPNQNETVYYVKVFTSTGQQVVEQQVEVPQYGPFDLGTWIPSNTQ